LTLPFLSYGGSSLLITLLAMAVLMRIYRDTKLSEAGLLVGPKARKPKAAPVRRSTLLKGNSRA
jgi:cell division protein FtsW